MNRGCLLANFGYFVSPTSHQVTYKLKFIHILAGYASLTHQLVIVHDELRAFDWRVYYSKLKLESTCFFMHPRTYANGLAEPGPFLGLQGPLTDILQDSLRN